MEGVITDNNVWTCIYSVYGDNMFGISITEFVTVFLLIALIRIYHFPKLEYSKIGVEFLLGICMAFVSPHQLHLITCYPFFHLLTPFTLLLAKPDATEDEDSQVLDNDTGQGYASQVREDTGRNQEFDEIVSHITPNFRFFLSTDPIRSEVR